MLISRSKILKELIYEFIDAPPYHFIIFIHYKFKLSLRFPTKSKVSLFPLHWYTPFKFNETINGATFEVEYRNSCIL